MSGDSVLYREILYWRQLLDRVAAELELKAGTAQDIAEAHWCGARAMRIRRRLNEGVPTSFQPSPKRLRRAISE